MMFLNARSLLLFGALGAFFAVALGAFAAHGLKSVLPANLLEAFRTGVDYQMYHSIALLALSPLLQSAKNTLWIRRSALFLLVGIFLFSGSLYLMALTKITLLGIITPLGGVSFLIGWLCLTIFAFHHRTEP